MVNTMLHEIRNIWKFSLLLYPMIYYLILENVRKKGVLDGDRIIIDDCVAIPNNDSINIYKNDGVLTYKKLSF